MSLEVIVLIVAVVSIAAAFLFFALARRAVRLLIRLIVVFVVIFVVMVGVLLVAWYGSGNDKASPPKNRPANTRRGNSR